MPDTIFSPADYMALCLELAQKGLGLTAPNPLVGAVVAHNNKILGTGYHKKFGEAHAEVNAIESVKDKTLLKESTLYVNLEPCIHFGHTPPCADFIIKAGIPRVVVGVRDISPKANGQGIRRLREAGIEVANGLLQSDCIKLNKRFYTFHHYKRPWIILKWAQTEDGFIARENFDSKWISCKKARELVHRWRSQEEAIMVGTNTAVRDNPRLTVRHCAGESPVRIILDRSLRVPRTHYIYDRTAPTWVFNELEKCDQPNLRLIKIDFKGNMLQQILNSLYQYEITSLFVEGGYSLLSSFIAANLWDEARVFTAPKTFGAGIKAPEINGNPAALQAIDGDNLRIYNNTWLEKLIGAVAA